MAKVTLLDVAVRLFGYYLFNRKDAERIKELEDQLYEANSLIKDVAWLTQPNKVGATIDHKEAVIESTHHYISAYCKRHGLNYEEV